MDTSLHGTPPTGASVTSGTLTTYAALGAGDVTINTVAMPAMAGVASAALRCDQIVAAINSMQNVTRVFATKVTSVTFKLQASEDIVIAALGGTATAANCGLTAATTSVGAMAVLDTRAAFGTNASGTDEDIVNYGNMTITLREADKLGLLSKMGSTWVQNQAAQTPSRADA